MISRVTIPLNTVKHGLILLFLLHENLKNSTTRIFSVISSKPNLMSVSQGEDVTKDHEKLHSWITMLTYVHPQSPEH